jgi:hypothetical protein
VAGVRDKQAAARGARVLTVPLLAVTVATCSCTTLAGAAAARIRPQSPAAPRSLAASLASSGTLAGVAAVSAGRAWAVGSTGGRTLIVRWNGTSWQRVHSPNRWAAATSTAWPTAPSCGAPITTSWACRRRANSAIARPLALGEPADA